jgi:hypothetical protein
MASKYPLVLSGTTIQELQSGDLVPPDAGGTGVNNGANTITLTANVSHAGGYTQTFTATGATSVTLPTSGTLVNSAVTTLSSLSSIGTIGTGTWQGSVIGSTYGGTGVNNGSNTITLGGSLTTSGAYTLTLTQTANTNVTLPTTGTLATLAGSETFTNKTLTSPTLNTPTLTTPTVTNALVTTMRETANVSATAATGTVNFDALTQVVLYYTTNASGNFTVNFRGNSTTTLDSTMSTGQSLSTTFLVTNGSTAYYNSAVTVDGNSVSPKWQGGTAPTSGNASAVDSYTYVIVKTASNTYTILASQTKFA